MKLQENIPYGKQHVTQEDIDAVVDVLRSDFLTQGPCVPKFEKKISEYSGAKYAVNYLPVKFITSLFIIIISLSMIKYTQEIVIYLV